MHSPFSPRAPGSRGRPGRPSGSIVDCLAAPPAPTGESALRADTLFLFAASGAGAWGAPGTNARGYTFDDGAGGPAPAGWTPWDATSQAGAYWHLQSLTLSNGHDTDFSAADDFANGGPTAGNDYAWWCGRENACGWANPNGYGTNWDQWLVLNVPAMASAGTVAFDYIGDFEGGEYDNFTLYRRSGAADPVELAWNHASGEQTVIHYGPIAFGDVDELIFAFRSDGGWSDEDGSFLTDIGAVWIDNLEIDYSGAPDVAWDFESGIEADFPALEATYPAGAGAYGALYAGLFAEDPCITNGTHAWAFFDLNTTNPDYPIPVTPYGPPYFDNGIQSPLFERAHGLGDPVGQSVDDALDGNSKFLVRAMVYCDLPINSLVFYQLHVAAQVEGTPCLSAWVNNNTVYYGDDDWRDVFLDYTIRMATAAHGGNVQGLSIAFTAIDMCEVWCGSGDAEPHTPAPYFDTISAMLVDDSGIAWNVDVFRRFQDNFPEAERQGAHRQRHRRAAARTSTTLVIGDSTKIDLNMDGDGGIRPDLVSVPGEVRPSLYLYARLVAGPHAGSTDPAMGDPDASDGIWSPHIGTAVVHGETWNVAIADTARYQGTPSPGSWAFDFAEDYFEAGDVLAFYYKATSGLGTVSTQPLWAESADPLLRSSYTVRCLPTAGATMLYCDDDLGILPWWEEAFRYNGYEDYDVYATQAPSSGLHNGLGGRAEIGDIDQYEVIVWDSGSLPSYTIQNALPDDITFDDVLLDDWLVNSAHNSCLWVMGNELASDQADEPSFLNEDLGAVRILTGTYYDDLTGIKVPRVYRDASGAGNRWPGALRQRRRGLPEHREPGSGFAEQDQPPRGGSLRVGGHGRQPGQGRHLQPGSGWQRAGDQPRRLGQPHPVQPVQLLRGQGCRLRRRRRLQLRSSPGRRRAGEPLRLRGQHRARRDPARTCALRAGRRLPESFQPEDHDPLCPGRARAGAPRRLRPQRPAGEDACRHRRCRPPTTRWSGTAATTAAPAWPAVSTSSAWWRVISRPARSWCC